MNKPLYKITTSNTTRYATTFKDCIRIGTALFQKEKEKPVIYKWNGSQYVKETK